MRALVYKELREVAGLTALAAVCYVALVSSLMGAKVFDWVPGLPRGVQDVPFVRCGFVQAFTVITAVFAIALGFRQSAWESARGTYLFLLHLPRSREAVFLTKMATGAAVLVGCSALAVVVYAGWAAVPGTQAGPFEWSMTAPAWRLVAATPLAYAGAFLSGLRPARWFGTRLLPLLASLALLVMATDVHAGPAGMALAACGYAAFVVAVCLVARVRDYS